MPQEPSVSSEISCCNLFHFALLLNLLVMCLVTEHFTLTGASFYGQVCAFEEGETYEDASEIMLVKANRRNF